MSRDKRLRSTPEEQEALWRARSLSDEDIKGYLSVLGIEDGPGCRLISMSVLQRDFTTRLMKFCELDHPDVQRAFILAASKGIVGVSEEWLSHWEIYKARGYRLVVDMLPDATDADTASSGTTD